MLDEAGDRIVERGLLMGPQAIGLGAPGQRFRLLANQVGPVEGLLVCQLCPGGRAGYYKLLTRPAAGLATGRDGS